MKNQLKVLIIFALLIILLAANTSHAKAQNPVISIGPDLPNAEYTKQYSQQLTVEGATEPYNFSLLSGTLPEGIELRSDGLLSGYPEGEGAVPGTYPITIQVLDANSETGTRDYEFVVEKGTPTVDLYPPDSPYLYETLNFHAEVNMDTGLGYSFLLPGTMTFAIDDISVPGCDAVPCTAFGYSCSEVSLDLDVGTHTIKVIYTPMDGDKYNYAEGSSQFDVQPIYFEIRGNIFNDLNQNGTQDSDENTFGGGWPIDLDQECDGTVEESTSTVENSGYYLFENVTVGNWYCITPEEKPGYVLTTGLPKIWLTENNDSADIGYYHPTLNLSPTVLPHASYNQKFSQTITASDGTGPYVYTISDGTLPTGITLSAGGLLSGIPEGVNAKPGIYPITIQVEDANSETATRDYDFVVEKSMPTMTVGTSIPVYWNRAFNLRADVKIDTDTGVLYLEGTVDFKVDGEPVSECQDVPYADGYYFCEGVTSLELSVGDHSVSGVYTPSENLADYYTTADSSKEFTVNATYFNLAGTLFKDQNKNGLVDSDEYRLGSDWKVNLDQDCDEKIEQTTVPDYWGSYSFNEITAGHFYCISVDELPGYQRTTDLPKVWLTENSLSNNIGYYYPTILLSPDQLSSVQLGQPIYQEFTASGGTGPYNYRISWGTLPDDLSFSVAGVLSGTPTAAGSTTIEIEAKDANQVVGTNYYRILVKTDGLFTFTSSANPSLQGNPVTFTVSASGSANDPNYGPIPPYGPVTFYVDGIENENCSYLYLNQLDGEIGNYPVTCVVSALGVGSHQITANFSSYSDVYNTPTLTLTQTVQSAASANLSIQKMGSGTQVRPGSWLMYNFRVSNFGPNTAQNLKLIDTLDSKTFFISTIAPFGWTCRYTNLVVTCTSPSLARGRTVNITVIVMVKIFARPGQSLVNTANVTSTTPDPNQFNNSVTQTNRIRW